MDKRGKFQGKINHVQNEALMYLYIKNNEEIAQLEEERMKMNILANNPELYKKIFMDTEHMDDIQWITPQNMKEADEIIRQLDEIRTQGEIMNAP